MIRRRVCAAQPPGLDMTQESERAQRTAVTFDGVWRDALIVVLLAAMAFLASYAGAHRVDRILTRMDGDADKAWFDSDTPRVFENMTRQGSDHYRTKVHPLFSLLVFPVVKAMKVALRMDSIEAARTVIALAAALWLSLLFLLLRLTGCNRLDALIFCGLGATSAFAMFWFVVPETYPFGSISILIALSLVALAQYVSVSPVWFTVVSALTLSFASTNWMAGIVAAFAKFPRRRALQITANALCLVVLLWGIEKLIFPSAVFFLGDREESRYTLPPESGGPVHIIESFAYHSIVMPAMQVWERNTGPAMTIQFSHPGSARPWGPITVVLWTALLALGVWGLSRPQARSPFRAVLSLTLLGQLVLHLFYGLETFLYAADFGPLLIVLAAFSLRTRARAVARVLAAALTVMLAFNNGGQFEKATKFIRDRVTQRYLVQEAVEDRPSDPWPRGAGHVILAIPGTHEHDKAYHEPGGSFSPSVGSFGLSLWITDAHGNIVTTSDTIPLDLVRQQLVGTGTGEIPGISTESTYYRAQWTSSGPGRWVLKFRSFAGTGMKPMVVIRSVGPAGGPIWVLDWNGRQLRINDRWTVTVDPRPAASYIGEEGPPGWKTAAARDARWASRGGWGYARLELTNGAAWTIAVEDTRTKPEGKQSFPEARRNLQVDVPDERFVPSLNAQVSHMMMGVVGRETRPGDPTTYPLHWLRDGAFVIVALARSGELEAARALSTDLAENDFFGGFGPEADAPGLAIWALEEVAIRLHEPAFDRWLWPHVRRKVGLIVEMLSATHAVSKPVGGPIVPAFATDPDLSLVAEPARGGLIIGRMDNHRPVLYVNAVSYLGLLDAAELADRVNAPRDAVAWRGRAAGLRRAWVRAFSSQNSTEGSAAWRARAAAAGRALRAAFRPLEPYEAGIDRWRMSVTEFRQAMEWANEPDSGDPRTYISGLWPTWVGAPAGTSYLQALEGRWGTLRDNTGAFKELPQWPYFDIAEAHQWLFFDRQDKVWATLNWFWDHQASPGLFTWCEGTRRYASGGWAGVRGWVGSPCVTPHYWAAAEMLLLQLDMLAYVDQTTVNPILVIGAGIPSAWLQSPMSVRKLLSRVGEVDWTWNGREMNISLHGCRCPVRLGSAFPPNTPVHIQYLNVNDASQLDDPATP